MKNQEAPRPALLTRRALLETASATIAGAVFSPALAAVPAPAAGAGSVTTRRLSDGWEYYHGGLGGIWEVWRGKAAAGDDTTWETATVPHCFNALDATDPDRGYYEGPGWYRTSLALENPFPNGRTLLSFQGTGQRSRLFVGLEQAGEHLGGYDYFIFDITDAAARDRARPDAQGKVRIAVMCDNSQLIYQI